MCKLNRGSVIMVLNVYVNIYKVNCLFKGQEKGIDANVKQFLNK